MQDAGYEVLLASDGVEAVSLVSANTLDLVLLDIMLPKIDGYTVCEVIRKQSNIPNVMLTALIEAEERYFVEKMSLDDCQRFQALSNLHDQMISTEEENIFSYSYHKKASKPTCSPWRCL